jgi:hypothetical protein
VPGVRRGTLPESSPGIPVSRRTGPGSEPALYQPPRPVGSSSDTTVAQLARRNFPAGLEPPLPPGADLYSSFHRRLATSIKSGINGRRAFSGGSNAVLVERVTFADGTIAVHKVVYAAVEVHSEVLASLVGHAIGARVPTVYQADRCDMYMELMPGKPAVELLMAHEQQQAYVESRGGLLLGALDALIDNYDRHVGNWIIAEDGTIAGIDHTAALTGPGRPGHVADTIEPGHGAVTSPFARHWFIEEDDNGLPQWKDNLLHPADVDQWLPAITALKPQFHERGYAGEWLTVVGRLRAIRLHAKGPQPWLTPPTRLNSPSPEPKATSSRRPGAR